MPISLEKGPSSNKRESNSESLINSLILGEILLILQSKVHTEQSIAFWHFEDIWISEALFSPLYVIQL